MFRRLYTSDGPIFGGGGGEGGLGKGVYTGGGGAYIRDNNYVTYLGVYIWGGLIYGGHINGFLWYMVFVNLCH